MIDVINNQALKFDGEEECEGFYFQGILQKSRDLLKKVRKNLIFNFDKIFDTNSTNHEIYVNTTKNLINTLMDGYNCSIFAYGATGAGKTHTMLGHDEVPGNF